MKNTKRSRKNSNIRRSRNTRKSRNKRETRRSRRNNTRRSRRSRRTRRTRRNNRRKIRRMKKMKGGDGVMSGDKINEFLSKYKLYMVRHGYSCGNLYLGKGSPRKKLQGKTRSDPHLTTVGRNMSDTCVGATVAKPPHTKPEDKAMEDLVDWLKARGTSGADTDLCDLKSSYHFASPLIRAQETSVRMFAPEKLIILPYCGEHQGWVDDHLLKNNDNTPYRKIWEDGDQAAIQGRINQALGMVDGSVENIDVSLFCDQELPPYEIAKSQPDIIKFFEGLIGYVEKHRIPSHSHLYVVTHSHFMLSLGLHREGNTEGKPFNNSIYWVKSFNARTNKFTDSMMIKPGYDEGDIKEIVDFSPSISGNCDFDKIQREGMGL